MLFEQYQDFVIEAGQFETDESHRCSFAVRVFDSPVGQGEREERVTIPPDLDLICLSLARRDLDRDIKLQIQLGLTLAGLLLPEYARSLYQRSLDLVAVRNEGLRLQLHLDDALAGYPWERKHEPVLGTLAVAQEPLKEDQVACILGRDRSQIRRDLTRLLPYLARDESVPPSRRQHSLFHRAFVRFLLDGNLPEEFWCEEPLQHGRIAAHIKSCAADWSRCDPYCLEYAAHHFIRAGRADELESILTKEFSDASAQRLGWHMPFVRNLEQALDVLGPERVARLCVEVIVGTRPNNRVNQRILHLMAETIRPALQKKGASFVREKSRNDKIIDEALSWLEPPVAAEAAVPALERLFAQAKGPVQGFVGLALGATRSPLATPRLLDALRHKEREIGWCIADALLELNDRSIIPTLIADYKQPTAMPGYQTRILYVLGRMQAREARDQGLIASGLIHRSPCARAHAANMSSLLAPVPDAEAIIWERLGFRAEGPAHDTVPIETQEFVQHRLVTALGLIGTEPSLAHLRRYRTETLPRLPLPTSEDKKRARRRLEWSLDRAIGAIEKRCREAAP